MHNFEIQMFVFFKVTLYVAIVLLCFKIILKLRQDLLSQAKLDLELS